jgi:hypothetical protein
MLAIKLQLKKIKKDLYFVKGCFHNIHTIKEFLVFAYVMLAFSGNVDTPLNSSRDPKVGPRAKQQKKKKVGACFLIHSISGVRGFAGALGWD